MSAEITTLWARLKEPFAWPDIEIKVQSYNDDKTRGAAVAYVDARAVRQRLNDVFQPHNWKPSHREIVQDGKVIGVVCKITITLPDGTTAEREDVGTPSSIEPIKGAYSDSIKRAFAAFGNDHLYHINLGWHPLTNKKFAPAVVERIKAIYIAAVQQRMESQDAYIYEPEDFYDEPEAAPKRTKADKVLEKLGPSRNGGAVE
jgi:hypothetical protein